MTRSNTNSDLELIQYDAEELLQDSSHLIENISNNLGRYTYRTRLYFQFLVASDYYYKSILTLSRADLPYTNNSLLRSLWENALNLDYISIDRSNNTALTYRLTKYFGQYGHKSKIEAWKSFRAENPTADTWSEQLTDEKLKYYWENSEENLRRELKRLAPKPFDYNYFLTHLWPSPKLRARKVDEHSAKRNATYLTRVEWDYLVVFWLLSEEVHVGPEALDNLSEMYLNPSSAKRDIDNYLSISVAYSIHAHLMIKASRHLKMPLYGKSRVWRTMMNDHMKKYSESKDKVT